MIYKAKITKMVGTKFLVAFLDSNITMKEMVIGFSDEVSVKEGDVVELKFEDNRFLFLEIVSEQEE